MKKIFIFLFLLLAGVIFAGCSTAAAQGDYNVIITGDVHFDGDQFRDPAVKRPQYQEKEKKRNLENWAKNIPDLLDRAAGKVNSKTAFVMQLGDISQGDCGKRELHENSLKTARGEFLKRFSTVPFLVTPGNHDIRGKGAEGAYQSVMIPYIARTLKVKLPEKLPLQYTVTQGKDLYIFFDSNHPDYNFLEKTIAAHPDRRHLFIVTHFPILPVSKGNPAWTVYGRPAQPELRKKLIDLLAKNNAIILCGHIHAATLARWQDKRGSMVQVTFFSIASADQLKARVQTTKRDLKDLFPKVKKMKKGQQKQQLAVVNDFISGYKELCDITPAAGFAVLNPSDEGVTLELYNTPAAKPSHQFKLK